MTAAVALPARLAFLLVGLGVVAVTVAWAGSSTTPLVGREAAWGAVGVAGTFAVVAGSLLWVAVARAAVTRRAAELRALIAAGVEATRAAAGPATPVAAPVTTAAAARPTALVATSTMVRYHRPDCRLVTGKPVEAAGRAEHERAGRAPCGVCEP
jgi:hypothetical protein